MVRRIAAGIAMVLAAGVWSVAQAGTLFVSRPGQVIQLLDRNGDGDFLDFAEATTYAQGLSSSVGALVSDGDRRFIVDPLVASVVVMVDVNGDGDALDASEAIVFGQLPLGNPPPVMTALAKDGDGSLLTVDSTTGTVFRLRDVNGDGDALDSEEVVQVATGMILSTALAVRPDGIVLASENSLIVPVRILRDRNGDGDYLDFAENISYAEGAFAGADIEAVENQVAFMARQGIGSVLQLRDLTGDNDVLDFGEIVTFAEGLGGEGALAADASGGLFFAADDPAGTVYHLIDLNGDGDALDFAERLVVALGISDPRGLAFDAFAVACMGGDVNADGEANAADIAALAQVLVGDAPPVEPCRADLNGDGQVDGLDISGFVSALIP